MQAHPSQTSSSSVSSSPHSNSSEVDLTMPAECVNSSPLPPFGLKTGDVVMMMKGDKDDASLAMAKIISTNYDFTFDVECISSGTILKSIKQDCLTKQTKIETEDLSALTPAKMARVSRRPKLNDYDSDCDSVSSHGKEIVRERTARRIIPFPNLEQQDEDDVVDDSSISSIEHLPNSNSKKNGKSLTLSQSEEAGDENRCKQVIDSHGAQDLSAMQCTSQPSVDFDWNVSTPKGKTIVKYDFRTSDDDVESHSQDLEEEEDMEKVIIEKIKRTPEFGELMVHQYFQRRDLNKQIADDYKMLCQYLSQATSQSKREEIKSTFPCKEILDNHETSISNPRDKIKIFFDFCRLKIIELSKDQQTEVFNHFLSAWPDNAPKDINMLQKISELEVPVNLQFEFDLGLICSC